MDLRSLPGYIRYLYLTRLVVDNSSCSVWQTNSETKAYHLLASHKKSFQRKFRDLNKNVLTSYFVCKNSTPSQFR